MLRTYLYIPPELDLEVKELVKSFKISKAEVLRMALATGVNNIKEQSTGGAEVLLNLSKSFQNNKERLPKDASINHDFYLWGLPKIKRGIKK